MEDRNRNGGDEVSLEDDLRKFEGQVNSFSIAGASGNFHTGFSIGDDARGSGAGVRHVRSGGTVEERIAGLEQSFKNLTIRGGHDVSVAGSLLAGGFAISAKSAPSGEGTGVGPPPPATGACCADDGSCSITVEGDCVGTYQGDDTVCDPNPCPPVGGCCTDIDTCEVLNETACSDAGGVYLGDGSNCDDPSCGSCPPDDTTLTLTFSGVIPCLCADTGLNFDLSVVNTTFMMSFDAPGNWSNTVDIDYADCDGNPLGTATYSILIGCFGNTVQIEIDNAGLSAVFFFGTEFIANGVTVSSDFIADTCDFSANLAYGGTATLTW